MVKKRQKHGGRQKGTPNKITTEMRETLKAMGCDPVEFLARVMTGNIPCPWCANGKPDKDCGICEGSGVEYVPPAVRVTAGNRLMDSLHPKLANKTVEKTTRRVVLGRMNAAGDQEREKLQELVDKAGRSGELEE